MNYTQAFQSVNLLALLTWLFIIFLPNMKYTRRIVFGFTIFLLSVVYAWMVFSTFKMDDFKEFSTLQGLMTLFQSEQAVLLGWIHYLAFDLMVGLYILDNGQKANIKPRMLQSVLKAKSPRPLRQMMIVAVACIAVACIVAVVAYKVAAAFLKKYVYIKPK